MRFASPLRLLEVIVATFTLVAPETGCSSEEVCRDYEPPASFDAMSPAVSFSKDVMPIFSQSCAFTSCHGSTIGSTNGVFLGGSDATKVHKAIVDVRSTKLQSMSHVKPGDPRESFLQRKIDGSHCVLKAQCNGDCGQSMPRNDDRLPLDARDKIRRWIAQGAKND